MPVRIAVGGIAHETNTFSTVATSTAISAGPRVRRSSVRLSALHASLLIGCAWTDSPWTRVTTVVSGTDDEAVRRTAHDLAARSIRSARTRRGRDSGQ